MTDKSILIDQMPNEVDINGFLYPVNYGFKTGIKMDIAYHDEKCTVAERYLNMMYMFYPQMPDDIEEALHKMLWFFTRGAYDPVNTESMERPGKKEPRQFCFNQDTELILAAFLGHYGIRLNRIQDTDMHWWEFMQLFSGLPEETTIKQYIYIRTCDLSELPDTERKRIKRIRNRIRIREDIKDEDLSPEMRLQKRDEMWLEYAKRRSAEAEKE